MEHPVELISWAAISLTVGHTHTHQSETLIALLPKQIEELQVSFRGKHGEKRDYGEEKCWKLL